jgi:DNA-binding HxlR family transcriptional regulator
MGQVQHMVDIRLNNADEAILRELRDGRGTAAFLDRRTEWSREYITQRLRRLEEHGIVENLEDTGLYELRDDPLRST